MVGIHFGTFIGAESESLEAIIELQEAVEDAGVKPLDDPNEDDKGRMGVTDLGETYCVPSESTFFDVALRERMFLFREEQTHSKEFFRKSNLLTIFSLRLLVSRNS
jgi:hypothetical protein